MQGKTFQAKLNIGVDIRLLGSGGGISRYIEGMVRELSPLVGADRLHLFGQTPGDLSGAGVFHNVKVNVVEYYSYTLPSALKRNGIGALFAPSAGIPLVSGCRVVGVIYDVSPLRNMRFYAFRDRFGTLSLTMRAKSLLQLATMYRAHTVIGISKSTVREAAEEAPFLRSKLRLIYPDVSPFFSESAVPRERFLLNVGGFNPIKNQLAVIRAHRRLNELASAPIPLVLAGYNGWPGYDVRNIVNSEGIPALTTVILRPSDDTIRDLFRRCTVATYVSLHEGFGMPILEAIRCGAPVVVHDGSSLPEVAPLPECRVNSLDIEALARRYLFFFDSDSTSIVRALQEHCRRFSFSSAAAQLWRLLSE